MNFLKLLLNEQSQNYIMDLTNEASIRAKKDNELEKQVDSLMNNYKDKKQIFIESSFLRYFY